jgi:hypothetical protein
MMLQRAPTVFAVPLSTTPLTETGAVFFTDATAASPQVISTSAEGWR